MSLAACSPIQDGVDRGQVSHFITEVNGSLLEVPFAPLARPPAARISGSRPCPRTRPPVWTARALCGQGFSVLVCYHLPSLCPVSGVLPVSTAVSGQTDDRAAAGGGCWPSRCDCAKWSRFRLCTSRLQRSAKVSQTASASAHCRPLISLGSEAQVFVMFPAIRTPAHLHTLL